jgi:hypothetical protein
MAAPESIRRKVRFFSLAPRAPSIHGTSSRASSGEDKLRRAEQRTGYAGQKIWKNQREHGERCQYSQRSARSVNLKPLFVMTSAAPQQA